MSSSVLDYLIAAFMCIRNGCNAFGEWIKTTRAFMCIRNGCNAFGEWIKTTCTTENFRRVGECVWSCMKGCFVVIVYFCQWIFEQCRSLCRPSTENTQRLRESIAEKEGRIRSLLQEKETLKASFNPNKGHSQELLQRRRNLEREINFSAMHEKLIPQLIQYVGLYLNDNLSLPPKSPERAQSGDDLKEQYKGYGLMLSACIGDRVGHGSPGDVKRKIDRQYQFLLSQSRDGFKIDARIDKALSMTWSMLTLLPPLLVTKPQCEYSEDILDTNRLTWDEGKSGPSLYYYRPVLVYGNRLHVAVKGLVGNCTAELPGSNSNLIEL